MARALVRSGKLLSAGVALLVGVAVLPSSAVGAFPGSDGRIAYVLAPQDATDSEIYSVNPDGSDPRALTDTPVSELDPSWSADGQRIVYAVAGGNGQSGVWIMGADGEEAHQLAFSAVNPSPEFAPSGDGVVFAARRGIATVAADGGSRQLLVKGGLSYPAYSPSGRKIVFSGIPKEAGSEHSGVWSVRSDGSRLRRLTRAPRAESDDEPGYSPDGRQIVFARHATDSPYGGGRVFLMRANGSEGQLISGGLDRPAFAPSGGALVGNSVSATLDGCSDLFVLRTSDSERERVTDYCGAPNASGGAAAASWQPLR